MEDQLNDKSKFKDLVILIVDDSKTSAVLIRQQISAFGSLYCNIDIASSYQDAIKHVEHRFYDVLILDYHLEQCINGNELATLLNKRKLISNQTGIILVSGDTSQETVLTVLSGEIQHFIKKPIQIHALGIKILSVCADKRSVNLAQNLIENSYINHIDKESPLLGLIENSHSPIIIESAILDRVVKNKQWVLLSSLLSHSITMLHMSKACAFGHLYCHKGETVEAISFLEEFLLGNPLAHQVMDKLAEIFIANERYDDALNVAFRSFECTPSINERMLTATHLATQQHDIEKLLIIGKTFALNLSIIDPSWLNAIVDYCECVLEIIKTSTMASQYNQILKMMKRFFYLTKKRLTAPQQLFLISYIQVFSAQVSLLRDNKAVAHHSLFKAISPHYGDLTKLPLVLKLKIIYLADQFSEFWLSEMLLKLSVMKNSCDKKIEQEIVALTLDAERNKTVGDFLLKMDKTRVSCNFESTHLFEQYQKMVQSYPYSIELQLLFFQASILCNSNENKIMQKINLLQSDNLLPPNWCSWLKRIGKEGALVALPLAFESEEII